MGLAVILDRKGAVLASRKPDRLGEHVAIVLVLRAQLVGYCQIALRDSVIQQLTKSFVLAGEHWACWTPRGNFANLVPNAIAEVV